MQPGDWQIAPGSLDAVPVIDYWHIYPHHLAAEATRPLNPTEANPCSQARCALIGTHAMWYAIDDFTAALWEVPLRKAMLRGRAVTFDSAKLQGLMAARLRPARSDVPLLDLEPEKIRRLLPDPDNDAAQELARSLVDKDHAPSHKVVRSLYQALQAAGITDMPALSWHSRMSRDFRVYLAYQPPMLSAWWHVQEEPVALDSPEGYRLIQIELGRRGYTWQPLAPSAERADDED